MQGLGCLIQPVELSHLGRRGDESLLTRIINKYTLRVFRFSVNRAGRMQ